jgi:hypothetical protein
MASSERASNTCAIEVTLQFNTQPSFLVDHTVEAVDEYAGTPDFDGSPWILPTESWSDDVIICKWYSAFKEVIPPQAAPDACYLDV